MDDCILSSLSLPPGTKPVINTTSCSPALKDSNPLEHKGRLDAPFNTSSLERASRRTSETVRQRLNETRDSGGWQLQVRGGNISQERTVQSSVSARPCDETIDLTTSETADTNSAANDNSQSLRGGRVLRKRKLSGGVDIPTKQPLEATAYLYDNQKCFFFFFLNTKTRQWGFLLVHWAGITFVLFSSFVVPFAFHLH